MTRSLALVLLLGLCGCTDRDVAPPAEGAKRASGLETQTLEMGVGWNVSWSKVEYPHAVAKIAACAASPGHDWLYVLNEDSTLYRRLGADEQGEWQAMRDLPKSDYVPVSVGCDGDYVYALSFPKLLRSRDGKDWQTVLEAVDLQEINSAGHDIWGLRVGMVWTGRTVDGTWTGLERLTYGFRVARATRALQTDLGRDRVFWLPEDPLAGGQRLHYSESVGQAWLDSVPSPEFTVVEISAADLDTVFVVTSAKELWRADFLETACDDDNDNDNDSFPDELDPDCFAAAGQGICQQQGDGAWCFSRFNDNDWVLANCESGSLVSTETGVIAQCLLGRDFGTDFVPTE